ncbi:hypothetical protein DID75_05210 [Candidatus Marinamargulisbacteria bacterium SCGC AG-410-N11]|nr:hypothetical protein DID75_05210 [Candidatus Marinamargulisbacteria bacterium SCGC AG-410-N11]
MCRRLKQYLEKKDSILDLLSYLEKKPKEQKIKSIKIAIFSQSGNTQIFTPLLAKALLKSYSIDHKIQMKSSNVKIVDTITHFNPTHIIFIGFLETELSTYYQLLRILKKTTKPYNIILSGFPQYHTKIQQFKSQFSTLNITNCKHIVEGICQVLTNSPEKKTFKQQKVFTLTPDPKRNLYQPSKPAIPISADFQPKIKLDFKPEELWHLINPKTLYTLHLGYKGNFIKNLSKKIPSAIILNNLVNETKDELLNNNSLNPKAKWQCFKCQNIKNHIVIFNHEESKILDKWSFPIEKSPPFRHIPAYFSKETMDIITLFVTTIGSSIKQQLNYYFKTKQYQKMCIAQALAMQTAEALAEKVHSQIRQFLNINHNKINAHNDLSYQGRRYSFGYAACPDLSYQKKLFKLLKPKEIGISLTNSFTMNPEGSVSGFVTHHPDSVYFSVSDKAN